MLTYVYSILSLGFIGLVFFFAYFLYDLIKNIRQNQSQSPKLNYAFMGFCIVLCGLYLISQKLEQKNSVWKLIITGII
jgi:uncharacterized membrane protein YuzA (DUF378 family)